MKGTKRGYRRRSSHAFLLVIAVLLAVTLGQAASAAGGAPQEQEGSASGSASWEQAKTGSISVRMYSGGNLLLYKVAKRAADGKTGYILTDSFSGLEESAAITDRINDSKSIASAAVAKKLADYAASAAAPRAGERKASDTGFLKFENLTEGLYLVLQTEAAAGYEKMAPFLVSIPGSKDSYDVDASPKMELKKTTNPKNPSSSPSTPSSGRLPQTGQLWWLVVLLAAAGVMFITAGLVLGRK